MELKFVKNINDISKYSKLIPREVIEDVKSRLGDYSMSNNGEIDKQYLFQQLRYLDNIVKRSK